MYDYGYGYDYGMSDMGSTAGLLGGLAAIMGIITIVSLAISVISIVSQWIIYKKAGKKGWESIVPIYNIIVLLQIVELPMWYIALFFVPIANIYAMFKIYIELAHKFGKSTGFGVATVFFNFICLPILAFGKNNTYNGNGMINTQPETIQYTPNNMNELNNQDSNVINQSVNTFENNLGNTFVQEPTMLNQTPSVPENNMTPNQIFDTSINNQVNPINNVQEPVESNTNVFNQTQNDMPTMNVPQQPFVQNQMNQQASFVTPSPVVEQPIQETPQQNTFVYGNQPMGQPENTQMGMPTMNEQPQQPFAQNQNPNNNPYNQNM